MYILVFQTTFRAVMLTSNDLVPSSA